MVAPGSTLIDSTGEIELWATLDSDILFAPLTSRFMGRMVLGLAPNGAFAVHCLCQVGIPDGPVGTRDCSATDGGGGGGGGGGAACCPGLLAFGPVGIGPGAGIETGGAIEVRGPSGATDPVNPKAGGPALGPLGTLGMRFPSFGEDARGGVRGLTES